MTKILQSSGDFKLCTTDKQKEFEIYFSPTNELVVTIYKDISIDKTCLKAVGDTIQTYVVDLESLQDFIILVDEAYFRVSQK